MAQIYFPVEFSLENRSYRFGDVNRIPGIKIKGCLTTDFLHDRVFGG
jgi:hypothetical protein